MPYDDRREARKCQTVAQNHSEPLKNKIAPTFLTYSKDDKHYPGGQNYADAMKKSGQPFHLKLYGKGGHGMSGCDWFSEATLWMKKQKIIK